MISDDDITEDKGCPPKVDRPLTWEELRDQGEIVEATEEVPEDLRNLWSDLSVSRKAILRTVKRDEVEYVDLIPGYRPPWVGSTVKPKSVPRPTLPRLQYRGLPVEPLVIHHPDDRRTYNDTNSPWGLVCRVLSGAFVGSGVIIGPRHVLTASHCLNWGSSLSATIEVHRAGGTVAATAQAVAVWAYTKIHGPGDVDATNVDEDYAVIVTDQRIGDRFGFMGTRTYDSSWDDEEYWVNIGYPGDIANGLFPIFQKKVKLDEDEFDLGTGRAMTTSADCTKGQSGGPMFGVWDNSPYVVAVVSAEGGNDNWCSGGSDLSRLVKHARTEDP